MIVLALAARVQRTGCGQAPLCPVHMWCLFIRFDNVMYCYARVQARAGLKEGLKEELPEGWKPDNVMYMYARVQARAGLKEELPEGWKPWYTLPRCFSKWRQKL